MFFLETCFVFFVFLGNPPPGGAQRGRPGGGSPKRQKRQKRQNTPKKVSKKNKKPYKTLGKLDFVFFFGYLFCIAGKLDKVFFLCPVKFIRSQLLAQQCPFLVKKEVSKEKEEDSKEELLEWMIGPTHQMLDESNVGYFTRDFIRFEAY